MGAGTMADEPIRSGEFNAAMQAIKAAMAASSESTKDAINALAERVAGLESLNQATLMAKVAEAEATGEARGRQLQRLEMLEQRVDKASTTITALMVFLAGQALWWAFNRINGGR